MAAALIQRELAFGDSVFRDQATVLDIMGTGVDAEFDDGIDAFSKPKDMTFLRGGELGSVSSGA
jgi:hypothetical protein